MEPPFLMPMRTNLGRGRHGIGPGKLFNAGFSYTMLATRQYHLTKKEGKLALLASLLDPPWHKQAPVGMIP
jgi:hypothetical protein